MNKSSVLWIPIGLAGLLPNFVLTLRKVNFNKGHAAKTMKLLTTPLLGN